MAPWKCAVGLVFSLAIFVGLVAILGGPTESDSTTSIYSTWAIAHGSLSCAYPRANILAAPLYPLLSGGLVALLRIGSHTAFPTVAQLGPHCSSAVVAIGKWSFRAHAWQRTLQVGDLSWLALAGGVVALLRTTERGRRGWEPFTLVLLGVSLPVLMPLVEDFHPQDILAMGLTIAALAYARRGSWTWAGLFVGLAFTSQQFAVLMAVTLFTLAPSGRRLRFTSAALGVVGVVGLPLVILSSGRAVRSVFVGTGLSPSIGRTVLSVTGLHGTVLTDVSRIMPILAALGVALWAKRRFGPSVLEAEFLMSLLAAALCLRLVFELNIWGYYFMPLCVGLVVLDVIRGRVRGVTIAWIAMVTLVFNPVLFYQFATGQSYGLGPFRALQIVFLAVGLLLVVLDVLRRRIRWYLIAWCAVAAVSFALDGWMYGPPHTAFPLWLWQIALLSTAMWLIAGPIWAQLRARDHSLTSGELSTS